MFEAMLDEQRQLRLDLITEYSRDDPSDRVGSDADREVSDAVLHGAKSALADIDAALARMCAGTYGRCMQCTTAMPNEWLEVLPQFARCLDCESAARSSSDRPPWFGGPGRCGTMAGRFCHRACR
jgi:DnaK suppressor protein